MPVDISPASLPNAIEGRFYSQQLSTDAGNARWAVSDGALPPGIELSISGELAGAPTVPGEYAFEVSADPASSGAGTNQRTYAIEVIARLRIATDLPAARANERYSEMLSVSGGVAPYTFQVVGLPAGLRYDTGTGVISGTPLQPNDALRLDISIQDSGDPAQELTESMDIEILPEAARITTAQDDIPQATLNAEYAFELAAEEGEPPYTWSVINGVLPDGLRLDRNTGTIFGTPTRVQTSTFTIAIVDSDEPESGASAEFTIEVVEPADENADEG